MPPASQPLPPADRDWWRQAVVYQVYPRSFADANGDGVGDLPGVTSRVPYLRDLGVDALWLSPFYRSPLADGGYDVADHRDVDPLLGTLADADALVAAAHDAGLRVVVDVVPNHVSDQHPWFVAALAAGPGSPERARFHFRDGRGPDGSEPPSTWPSHFGGVAWTRVPDGQWYLHLFAPEQPDLNWEHPEVVEDLFATLRFWADRGVDGFRVDVAHSMVKDFSDLDTPVTLEVPEDGSHPYLDRDEVHDLLTRWRAVLDEYDPPRSAVAEAWVPRPRRVRYARPTELGQSFTFELLSADWDLTAWRELIQGALDDAAASGATSTWVLSNHDVVRHATRYGLPPAYVANDWLLAGGGAPLDRDLGLRRARAATLVLLSLPGSAYLYQGEELGLHEVAELRPEELQDPVAARTGLVLKGRDGCRVPLPWTVDGPSFGFGTGGAHLPQPPWFGGCSVQAQQGVPGSTLELYRAALHLRRTLQGPETLDFVDSRRGVLDLRRPGGWRVVANASRTAHPLPPGEVLLASAPLDGDLLPTDTTVWLHEEAR